jgi:hypothetical protein
VLADKARHLPEVPDEEKKSKLEKGRRERDGERRASSISSSYIAFVVPLHGRERVDVGLAVFAQDDGLHLVLPGKADEFLASIRRLGRQR